jgi:hypothetical protein
MLQSDGGFLFYEILALRQFSSEYVRRVKTRNSGFFQQYPNLGPSTGPDLGHNPIKI